MQSCKHTHVCALLPKIPCPIGGYFTLATQPYLCEVWHPDKEILYGSEGMRNTLGLAGGRRHMVEKDWPYRAWFQPREQEQPDFNINSGLL